MDRIEEPLSAESFLSLPESGPAGEAAFDSLARQVFAHQYRRIEPYRRFCEGRGVTPETLITWRDIPPAPAAAFKQFALSATPITDCVPEKGGRTFHSSGTTGSETSRHFLDRNALDVYRFSLRYGFRRFVLPDGARLPVFALMPPPAPSPDTDISPKNPAAPHSSLSFMLGELIDDHGGGFFARTGWQNELAAALRHRTEPLVLFGTAFAFVHFFDAISERFALPDGSRIVETGGFKGRSREISRDELYGLFGERFGVPPHYRLSEYGMSEMASQYYDSTLRDYRDGLSRPVRKQGAFWLRTRLIDPVTGTDAPPGADGLLAHYDPGNLNSVMAILTEDLGRWAEDGDGFHLLGRAPGAVLRGCSLTAEEWESRRGSDGITRRP
ncbi:MAG: hypothetical protein SFU56_15015 [Capsulimonadales bacterium]|nr:hypothetical protein [Capsulimonadales bacterium]